MRGEDGKFQPGFSGNPSGRPKVPEDLKKLAQEASDAFKRKFYYWRGQPIHKIQKCIDAPWEITGDDRMVCSAMVKAINGDTKAFTLILDRILGKAMQPLEMSGPGGGPIETLKTGFEEVPEDMLIRLGEEALEAMKRQRERSS